MMIPYGYKQTEVGVIPEDWSVSALEKLYNITSSKRVFQSQWRKSGVPFYRAREIAVMSEGKIAPEDLYIDESLYNQYIHQYGSINKNDILITGVGTLGKVYVVKENDRFYFKDGNIIWLQAKHDFSSIYLKYQYDMPALINQVFGNAGGSTVATYTITNAKTTKVPVPPLQEQQRIAEALSDVDGMISSLEKLIAKYKSIKTACLQQMFPQNGETVPRMRLPGFTGAWEQRKYGEVVETRRGLTYKPSDICDSGIRVLRSSNIDEDTFVLKADDVFVKKDAVNIDYSKENDILITSANGSTRLVGKHAIISSISGNPAVHGGFMLLGTTKEPYFINASMGSSWYRRFIELYVAGGNGAIGNLNKNDLDNQVILIPSEPEQRAIGAFFKQLDHLITLHQRKLEKVQKIKQGMMQQLLTGKIRLM